MNQSDRKNKKVEDEAQVRASQRMMGSSATSLKSSMSAVSQSSDVRAGAE